MGWPVVVWLIGVTAWLGSWYACITDCLPMLRYMVSGQRYALAYVSIIRGYFYYSPCPSSLPVYSYLAVVPDRSHRAQL